MNVVSHFQANKLLDAHQRDANTAVTSLDLGLTDTAVTLTPDHILLPDGQTLAWEQLQKIADNELACYLVTDNHIEKIQFFSTPFNRFYSLMPTNGAPTMLISGIPMHRIKGTEPHRDTMSKIKAVAPITGAVLDTTMGLGYTAIEAAKTADHVITIELDHTVTEICRLNPWSRALFGNPKIKRIIGDAGEEIEEFPAETFSRIIHDPPMFSLAGDLYGAGFYRQLLRVLKPKGKLFHYIGDPNSKSGRNVTRGVVRRLNESGFRRVTPRPQAFGVVAYK